MADVGVLATVASIIAAFGSTMLVFRIQRELYMHDQKEVQAIPWADRLLVVATLVCLGLVVLPLIACTNRPGLLTELPRAACAAAVLMVAGYILALLGHYRLLGGGARTGPRANPEPAEKWVVIVTLLLAVVLFAAILFRYPAPAQL
jgi:amino acid permease